MRKLVITLLAMFGLATPVVVFEQVTPAHAYLTDCHVIPHYPNQLTVNCYTVVNNGGLNQVRADASCAGANIIHAYGPWVGVRVNSNAYCPAGYSLIAWTYQLR